MYATLEQLQQINKIQLQILEQVDKTCRKLGIHYLMVHGSLLGTVRNNRFVPYDDDIDIAMKRTDYEVFLKEAPKIIESRYFIQSVFSDVGYPLLFAKVRDSRTTYICEAVKKIDMNHGVYIDIFPIDYVEKNPFWGKRFLKKLLSLRIGASLYHEKVTTVQLMKYMISCILCPSLRGTIMLRDRLYKNAAGSAWVCITGGKATEEAIPAKWFEETEQMLFEGVSVCVPKMFDAYLTHIYGDYQTRTLVEDKMVNEKVELNACIVDTERPYTFYCNK